MSSSATLDNASNNTALVLAGPTGGLFQIALRDISTLFRTPWIIISRSLAFIIQLFVFAALISNLVHIPTYPSLNFFQYYAIGSVVGTMASISFIIGYDIFEEAEEGVLDYLLTLPISTNDELSSRDWESQQVIEHSLFSFFENIVADDEGYGGNRCHDASHRIVLEEVETRNVDQSAYEVREDEKLDDECQASSDDYPGRPEKDRHVSQSHLKYETSRRFLN